MKWELFLDESGQFIRDEHCLVGGFVCEQGAMNYGVAKVILQEIRNSDTVKNLIERYDSVTGEKWNFNHCCENQRCPERWEIQAMVLQMLKEQIVRRGGKLIIFDNPTGTYNEDNTTNFLSVFAKGLMSFYLDTNPWDRIYVNVAERKNITYADENASVSPTSAGISKLSDKGTILKPQYVSQMNNLANLYGGQPLLASPKYSEMIANIRIMHDTVGSNGTESNPLTTICDYICNTYYAKERRSRKVTQILDEVFGSSIRIYNTNSPLRSTPVISYADHSRDNLGGILMTLSSHGYPEPETSTFYSTFNAADPVLQHETVSAVVNSLYPVVYAQIDMPEVLARLEGMIHSSKAIANNDIRSELHANLLLFAETLYMHLGNQPKVSEYADKAVQTIEKIADDSVKNSLLDKYENRMLVDLYDRFAYEEAESLFKDLNTTHEHIIAGYRRRNPHAKYPEYGKVIGSYLQVLRHRIHSASQADDREIYYLEAQDLYDRGLNNFTENEDISRFYQTRCDIESEMHYFKEARECLYKAALAANGREAGSEADLQTMVSEILDASGVAGEKNHYMYQHLVRLLSQMFCADSADPEAEKILGRILPDIGEEYGCSVRSIHPRTQIQWKTGSALAWRKNSTQEQRNMANRQMVNAADALLQSGLSGIFAAIAVGILAERAYHIRVRNIPGNLSQGMKKLNEAYEQFLRVKEANVKDPFAPFPATDEDPDRLLDISRKIGY